MYGFCFCCLWLSGIGPLQHIPIFVYGSLLSDVGFTFIEAHFVKPMKIYGRLKSSLEDRMVLFIVVVVFCTVGMLEGLAIGVILSLLLLVLSLHSHGSVRLETHGGFVRSSFERNPTQEKVLREFGSVVHVLRLQGYLFFATGADMILAIEKRLEAASTGSAKPLLHLVLDLEYVPACDVTSVRHFDRLRLLAEGGVQGIPARSGRTNPPGLNVEIGEGGREGKAAVPIARVSHKGFTVAISGCRKSVRRVLGPHVRTQKIRFYSTIDEGLEVGEEKTLRVFRSKRRPSSKPRVNSIAGGNGSESSSDINPPSVLWERFIRLLEDGKHARTSIGGGTGGGTSSGAVSSASPRAASSQQDATSEKGFLNTFALLKPVTEFLTTQVLAEGEILFHQGSISDRMYFVVQGYLALEEAKVRQSRDLDESSAREETSEATDDDSISSFSGQDSPQESRLEAGLDYDSEESIVSWNPPLEAAVPVPFSKKRKTRIRKLGPGCILASSEFHLSIGAHGYSARCVSTRAILVTILYEDLLRLESANPVAAMMLYKEMGYFLARKNFQSKRQVNFGLFY